MNVLRGAAKTLGRWAGGREDDMVGRRQAPSSAATESEASDSDGPDGFEVELDDALPQFTKVQAGRWGACVLARGWWGEAVWPRGCLHLH